MAEVKTFGVVVVLYKVNFSDSETLQSLSAISPPLRSNISIIVWDNSPEPFNSLQRQKLASEFGSGLQYISTPENISLAKVYNRSIQQLSSDVLVIFDQDTGFDGNFFKKAADAMNANPDVNLFLPVVKADNLIISPGDHGWVKGKYWTKVEGGKIKAANRGAVGSGMVIRMSYLQNTKLRFNEELQLYNIDTDFVLRYGEENEFMYVGDYELQHRPSHLDAHSVDKVIRRFRDHRRSIWIINRDKGVLRKIVSVCYMIYMSLKSAVQFRSLKFLK